MEGLLQREEGRRRAAAVAGRRGKGERRRRCVGVTDDSPERETE